MWEKIIAERGMAAARQIMEQEDDFSFIRNYLDEDMARELQLFHYKTRRRGREATVGEFDLEVIKEDILAPKFNFGGPHVSVTEVKKDGTLELHHNHETDERGLDLNAARKVLDYIQDVWRRPVSLHTVNAQGKEITLSTTESKSE
jgi:stage V sporulation protein R